MDERTMNFRLACAIPSYPPMIASHSPQHSKRPLRDWNWLNAESEYDLKDLLSYECFEFGVIAQAAPSSTVLGLAVLF